MQNAEGESIISVLAGVGWAIPLYTLPNQLLVDVYHDESPTLSSHNACLGGFCFVSNTVAILQRQSREVAKQHVEMSLWCVNLIKKLQDIHKTYNLICFLSDRK